MYIYWTQVTTSDLPITGYILEMDDGLNEDFSVIYDGSLNSQNVAYTVNNLIQGRTYNFRVSSVDINGQGPVSAVSSFISCIPPSGMDQPYLTYVDEISFTVNWNLPDDDGGCAITGYAIFSDNGTGGNITNPLDATTIAN